MNCVFQRYVYLGVMLAMLCSCSAGDGSGVVHDARYERQLDDFDRQSEIAAKQLELARSQLEEQARQVKLAGKLLDAQFEVLERYDKLLNRWEAHADRHDKLIDSIEQLVRQGTLKTTK